jgi:hypothetical protein
MNSTISNPFLSQKTIVISFLADSICLNFFWFLVDACASTALTALWFQFTYQNPGFFICCSYDVIEKFIAILIMMF